MARSLNRFTSLFLLVSALLCAPSAWGQGAYVPARSVNSNVNGVLRPVAGATVTVCAAGNANVPCAPPLAGVLFKDQALTQPLANPTTTDLNGNYPTMALAAGNYTITETAVGFTGFSYQITVTCGLGSCTLSGLSLNNTTFTGTTTLSTVNVSGTGTFQNIVISSGGSGAVASLQSALSTIQGAATAISTCTESSTTVTCTLATSPSIATGTLLYIQGVSQPGYNGLYTTNGGTANTITYLVNSSGLTAATGGSFTTGFGTVDATAITGNVSTQITNATGSIVIPAGVTLKLGPSVWTCSITTANMPCWQLAGDGAKLLGAGTGYTSSDSVDPPTGEALGATNLLCSSCGSTTDMIHVTVTNPTGFPNGIVKGARINGLWINMGASGEDAIRATAVNDFEATNNAAYNFNGNGLHVEGSVATGAVSVSGGGTCAAAPCGTAYHVNIQLSRFSAPHTNTTGANCWLDGVHGEVAYFSITTTRCSGNNTNGGGAIGMLLQTDTIVSGVGVDTGMLQGYFGNTANAAALGGVGIEFKGTGSWPASSAGTLNSITVMGSIIEHQFNPGSGIGITCVNNAGTRTGAACGDISMASSNAGGWSTSVIDFANLGEGFAAVASSQQDFGSPPFRASGNDTGPNAQGIRVDTSLNAAGASQVENGINNVPVMNDKGFASQIAQGIVSAPTLAAGGVAGNFATWEAAHFDGSGIANGIGLHVSNSDEIFDNTTRWTEGTVNTGGVSVVDLCKGLTAYHQFSCNNNGSAAGAGANSGFWPVGITGNTAGTHSDSGFYQTAGAAGCTTAASIGGICATAITITWPVAFQDANYKVVCTPVGPATNLPSSPYVVTPIAASVTINYFAITAAAASWPTVNCTGVHN